jgi:hypothetical protein
LHAAALHAVAEPESLRDVREWCQNVMRQVDIGDLMLEVTSWHPEMVATYTHVSGGDAVHGHYTFQR